MAVTRSFLSSRRVCLNVKTVVAFLDIPPSLIVFVFGLNQLTPFNMVLHVLHFLDMFSY